MPDGLDKLRSLAAELAEAQRPVRILRAIAWPDRVKEEFFARGAGELPRVTYAPLRFDVAGVARGLRAIGARADGDNEGERLVRETAESYARAAEMLGAVGTAEFWAISAELYGRPQSISCDGKTTNLDLADHFDRVIAQYPALGVDETTLTAEAAADDLRRRLAGFFGEREVRVEVVDELGANAVAGADVIKLKRGAGFSARDVAQLERHEGHVHVATSLNGRTQQLLPFLASGAPRTVRTQEGLAVFTELMSQTMDLERLRRLTDRILAIRMAEDGATFLDLYRWFLGHDHEPNAAFDCARRVCRGGRVDGGAPFTKDVVYLDGLLRVSNFLRATLTGGHAELVAAMFVGKLDLADVPALAHLLAEGALAPPRYIPAWAGDLRFLTSYMSYSAFLGEVDLPAARAYYGALIARAANGGRAPAR